MKFLLFLISTMLAGGRPTEDTITYMCSGCVLYDTESNTVFDYELPGSNQKPINRTIQSSQLSNMTTLLNTISMQLYNMSGSQKEIVFDMDEILTVDELNDYHLNMTNIFVSSLILMFCILNLLLSTFICYSRKTTLEYPLLSQSSDRDIVHNTYSSADSWD